MIINYFQIGFDFNIAYLSCDPRYPPITRQIIAIISK